MRSADAPSEKLSKVSLASVSNVFLDAAVSFAVGSAFGLLSFFGREVFKFALVNHVPNDHEKPFFPVCSSERIFSLIEVWRESSTGLHAKDLCHVLFCICDKTRVAFFLLQQ